MAENVTLQKYLARLAPHGRALFRMAHAITENAELAEYALLSAVRAAYLSLGDDVPFRDSIRHAVAGQALRQLARRNHEDYPADFSCFELSGDGGGEVGAWLAAKSRKSAAFCCCAMAAALARATQAARWAFPARQPPHDGRRASQFRPRAGQRSIR